MNRLAYAALSLWIGAVAGVAIVVIPSVFGKLNDNKLAGDVMAPIFRSVDLFGVAAAFLYAFAVRRHRRRMVLAWVLGVAATGSAVLGRFIAERAEHWELYHAIATKLWFVILLVGVCLVVVGPGDERKDSR